MKPKEQITAIIRQHLTKSISELAGFADRAEVLATQNKNWLPLVEETRKLVADFDVLAESGDLQETKKRMDDCILSWSTVLGHVQIGVCVN